MAVATGDRCKDLLEVLLKAITGSSPEASATSSRSDQQTSSEVLTSSVTSAVQSLVEERSRTRGQFHDLQEMNRILEQRLEKLENQQGTLACNDEVEAELRLELGREKRIVAETRAKAAKDSIEAEAQHMEELQHLRSQLHAAEQLLCLAEAASRGASPNDRFNDRSISHAQQTDRSTLSGSGPSQAFFGRPR